VTQLINEVGVGGQCVSRDVIRATFGVGSPQQTVNCTHTILDGNS